MVFLTKEELAERKRRLIELQKDMIGLQKLQNELIEEMSRLITEDCCFL